MEQKGLVYLFPNIIESFDFYEYVKWGTLLEMLSRFFY